MLNYQKSNEWVFRRFSRNPFLRTAVVFGTIFAFVLTLNFANAAAANTTSQSPSSATDNTSIIDNVAAANIAANIANKTNLVVANSVSSEADSLKMIAELSQTSVDSIGKTQIIDSSASGDIFANYVAVDGDTATTVANKFHVSNQTIRWANNLKDENITAGATMTIPLLDGVVYNAKSGDNLATVVAKYQSNLAQTLSLNDLSSAIMSQDQRILLPAGILPENERPEYVAPTPAVRTTITNNSSRISSGYGDTGQRESTYAPIGGGNGYAYGYCTWYAYNRRIAMGLTMGGRWGNANTWDNYARAEGYRVDHTPSVGAIFQTDAGYAGHVGIVEEVYPNGTIKISEMNNHAYGGWGIISTRTISNPGDYTYIH